MLSQIAISFRRRGSFSRSVLLPVVLGSAVLLSACGTAGRERDITASWTAEQLYQDAKAEVESGNWSAARNRLVSLESRYPFGVYAQQAMIDLAYVNWRDSEPEQALATIDRFQQQYPNHPGTDYMLYLKGLISFTPPSAFMANFTGQDPSERDPKGLRQSYDAFNELITRYPDSKYAQEARDRMAWLVNTIAMNEVHVARYYFERAAYLAAINRAQAVITDFEGVPATEEALKLMVLAYDKLGQNDLRDDTQRVLLANFPNATLVMNSDYDNKPSWWNPISWF